MYRLPLGAALTLAFCLTATADNWPQFRGPTGQGHTAEKDLPLKWSPKENVRWKVPLPDQGNSTPVVWGDKVFVTQATDKTIWPPKGGNGGPAAARKRSLLCFARADGKRLWAKDVTYEAEESTHPTNPFCAASPATDGERVVVSHGSAGVYCYDTGGKELWKRTDLGKAEHIWGNASSPVIHGGLVIVPWGPGENTFLIAMNKKTGKDVWKVPEPGGKAGVKGDTWVGSWSTPVVVKVNGREELIMTWPGVVKAYDPENGEVLWSSKGLEKDKGSDRLTYTSPLATDQVVVAMAGFGGPALAVKPGGKGDVTETHRLWRKPASPQRIGSGVIVGDHVYVVNDPGTAQCIEWKTGKEVWSERLGGNWGSLVHSDGRLYVTDLQGTTHVFAAKPEFELLARNPLKERTLASIAVSDGMLFIRTYQHLWCIGSGKAEGGGRKAD